MFAALFAGPVLAADDSAPVGSLYVLRYSGVVCAKAPCPVWEVVEVGTCTRGSADSIDTVAVSDADYPQDWVQSWLTQNPVTVRGAVVQEDKSEAILFKVLKILGGPDPRAATCPPDVGRE
jgi:hypothetical protein